MKNLAFREYVGAQGARGPLLFVTGVEEVGYDERSPLRSTYSPLRANI
jgi:hypothetical protein